ncbi:hypothetical protein VQZ45_001378 [Salmonella enterica]|nr:hypothetical protein [Salmonella enterica]EEJ7417055.1 hypothetical protein [Salmonella enterica subsp. enterica serovar Sandiego]HCM4642003.1 hypothetical protein [Salmonella enterica subsp. enterica serovar Panama]EIG1272158.1 hypothetical protein [Salmonella enterica]EJI9978179.1 hypothetical protein [Salmonella enterica]
MDSTHPELEFGIVAISYPLRRPPDGREDGLSASGESLSALPHVAPLSFPSPENKVRHADR